jgi:hypothetical protein
MERAWPTCSIAEYTVVPVYLHNAPAYAACCLYPPLLSNVNRDGKGAQGTELFPLLYWDAEELTITLFSSVIMAMTK